MANFPGSEISASPATHQVVLNEVKASALIAPFQPPFVATKWYMQHASNNSTSQLAEATIYVSWFPAPFGATISGLAEEVTTGGTAGAVRRLVIYKHNISTGLPDALLDDLGTYDATTTGIKSITGRTGVVDNYGGIWVGGITQGAAGTRPTLRATAAHSGALAYSSASAGFTNATLSGWATTAATHTGAAPANIGALSVSGAVARIMLQIG